MITKVKLLTAALAAQASASDKADAQARDLVIGGTGLHEEYFRFFARLQTAGMTCGATMIAPDLLLTAAHCPVPLTAEVGYFSNSDFRERINIADSINHPGFDPVTLFYDFKVIQLATLATNPYIVQLNDDPAVPSGETLTVMGIGDVNSGEGVGVPPGFAVQGGIVRLENDQDCEATRGLSASYADSLYDSMFCAVRQPGLDSSSNACNGDDGGPLLAVDLDAVTSDADVGVQVGVVSWGYDACGGDTRFPRVYSRVSSAFDWIRYIVCTQSADAPASFGCTANESAPPVPPPPSPPPATTPINFRYSMTTNFFSFENGVRIESVGRIIPATIQHVVPTALPVNDDFSQTVELSQRQLYAFTIVDTSNNGIQASTTPIELSMQQSNGDFTTFDTIQPNFGSVEVVFFYATSDGTIEDPFDAPKNYPGDQLFTLEMTLDEYPEEVSIGLLSGSEEIWFRPYRYYTKQPSTTITEQISIPNEFRSYTLSVRDSSGDGIGSAAYKLSYDDMVLVESVFEVGGVKTNGFDFDPTIYMESPTTSPTARTTIGSTTPSPTVTKTETPTSSPVEDATERSASPDKRRGWASTACLAISAMVSLFLQV